MATVKYDITSQDSITATRNGYSITAVAIVAGLTTTTPVGRVIEAVSTLGIFVGQPHATYTNSFLQSWSSESLHSDTVKITMNFEPMLNVPVEISVTGSTQEIETNLDKDSVAIEVSYTYPVDYPDEAKAGLTETVSKTIQKSVPSPMLTFRTRSVMSGNDLVDIKLGYEGKVNEVSWNIRPSDPAGVWLCSDISGDKVGVIGVNESQVWVFYNIYDITMTFNYSENGWDPQAVFTLDSGNVPDPATWTTDETQKTVAIYNAEDFSDITT